MPSINVSQGQGEPRPHQLPPPSSLYHPPCQQYLPPYTLSPDSRIVIQSGTLGHFVLNLFLTLPPSTLPLCLLTFTTKLLYLMSYVGLRHCPLRCPVAQRKVWAGPHQSVGLTRYKQEQEALPRAPGRSLQLLCVGVSTIYNHELYRTLNVTVNTNRK